MVKAITFCLFSFLLGLKVFGQIDEFLPIDPMLSRAPIGITHVKVTVWGVDPGREKGRKFPPYGYANYCYDQAGHLLSMDQCHGSRKDSTHTGWESWRVSSNPNLWRFRNLPSGDTLQWELIRDSMDRIIRFSDGPDPFGNEYSYSYGESGYLKQVNCKSIPTSVIWIVWKFSYDASGHLLHVEKKERDGDVVEYEYHYFGDRLDYVRFKEASGSKNWLERHYSYGSDGLIDKVNTQKTNKSQKVILSCKYEYEMR